MGRLLFGLLAAFLIGHVGEVSAADTAQSIEAHQQASFRAMERNDFVSAEAEAQRALETAERVLGPEHSRTVESLSLLAIVYRGKGRNEEAKPFAERALAISEKTIGPEHLETAALMSIMASIYLNTGDVAKAESLLRRSVSIKEKGFGPNHPFAAISSSTLADLLTAKGEYVEAERLNKRALVAVEKAWPADDPSIPVGLRANIPIIMEGLAQVHLGQLRLEEAEKLVARAFSLRMSIVGADHVSMVGNRKILGDIYLAWGRNAEAENSYREALRIMEKAIGSENEVVSNLLSAIADSCEMQGKYDVAAQIYTRCVAIDEKIFPLGHPVRTEHSKRYANILKVTGRAKEADQVQQRSQGK